MADTVDLEPAARQLASVVAHVQDSQLGDETPAGASTVGDLVDHVGGLAQAFTAAARKDLGPTTSTAPAPDAKHLEPDWRTTIPAAVTALAQAWTDRQPFGWEGKHYHYRNVSIWPRPLHCVQVRRTDRNACW